MVGGMDEILALQAQILKTVASPRRLHPISRVGVSPSEPTRRTEEPMATKTAIATLDGMGCASPT